MTHAQMRVPGLLIILLTAIFPAWVYADGPGLDPALRGAKYLDPSTPIDQRVDDLFGRLTLLEKVSILHGCAGFDSMGLPRFGLRKMGMTDGPQGVRGPNATAFPSSIAMASTWDPALIQNLGADMAEESLAAGSHMQLGPAMNIMRSPLGGRTFEYMGEDPLLTGKIAAGYVRGIQSKGVAACIKHYTCNEQEHWRSSINVEVPERALREIYARPFEICIRESHPWAIMAAYNKVDGDFCCHNRHLLVDLLRTDWKWDGLVVSDWGAWHDTAKAISGGGDLEMPGYIDPKRDQAVADLIEKGAIPRDMFDSAVKTNLLWMFRVGAFDPPTAGGSINTPPHQALARKVADDSIVLLKNTKSLLPLDAGAIKTIAVIGPAADYKFDEKGRALSAGSGSVYPPFEITPLQGIQNKLGDRVKVVYVPGYKYGPNRKDLVIDAGGINQAADAAKDADVALVFVGTNHAYDHEGGDKYEGADKPDLNLIGPATQLINAVTAANPKTVVVLSNGAPVSMEDWVDQVPALLETWYPGMEGGNAIADVLFGDVNPSGKLPCTFGKKLTDWKSMDMGTTVFPGTGANGLEKYDDGIWVGYRHFDHDGIEPRFPFGFGLSYTTFKLEDPIVHQEQDGTFTAQVKVTNTGDRDGAEVVEVYMTPPKGSVDRPVRELAAFAKVFLNKGQSQIASMKFGRDSLAYWSDEKSAWDITPGSYTFGIGVSSRELPLTASLNVR